MKFCPQCGASLVGGDSFCEQCGSRIDQEAPVSSGSQPDEIPQNNPYNPPPEPAGIQYQ